MKKLFVFLAALGMISLASCAIVFSGTSLSDSLISETQASLANGNLTGVVSLSYTSVNTPIDSAGGTAKTIQLVFGNGKIDAASLSGVRFYPLLNTNIGTDLSPDRGTQLNMATPTIVYNPSANTSTVNYTYAFQATDSSRVELWIDASVVTANSGAIKLDTDGDNVQGEAADDDIIAYISITGGVAASANSRAARPNFATAGNLAALLTALPTPAAGDTVIPNVITYAGVAVDATNYNSMLTNILVLEAFNASTKTWNAISYTGNYDTVSGAWTITLGTAILNGTVYRYRLQNLTTGTATLPDHGYVRKISFDNKTSAKVGANMNIAQTTATFDLTDVAFTSGTIITTFTSSRNGFVTITLNAATIGDEGINASSLTTESLKIYDTASAVYVPWVSGEVRSTVLNDATQKNDQIVLYFDPAYLKANHAFQLHVGPGLQYLGDSFALTTDDRFLGDWRQTTFPVGYSTVSGGTEQL